MGHNVQGFIYYSLIDYQQRHSNQNFEKQYKTKSNVCSKILTYKCLHLKEVGNYKKYIHISDIILIHVYYVTAAAN